MSNFLTELCLDLAPGTDSEYILSAPLVYQSDLIGRVEVPKGFVTDLASVPRLPIVHLMWGGRAHREAVLHDWLYRTGSKPIVSLKTANKVFLEAMEARDKPFWVRWPMYWGVCLGGGLSYHQKR